MERFKPKIKLISASAGTGKTYTLIEEISRVLKDTAPSKIAAITFTRAATRDIRSRVHEKFPSDVVNEININTIHGFFAGILREQSVYFKHSSDFKILEDFDQKMLFKRTASQLLLTKVSDAVYEKFFAEYNFENVLFMLEKMEGHYAIVRDKLNADIKTLIEQEIKAGYEKLKSLIPDDFNEAVVSPILNFKASSSEDKLEVIRKDALPHISELAKHFAELKSKDYDRDCFYRTSSLLKEITTSAPGESGSVKNWDSKDQLEKVKYALKTLNALRKEAVDELRIGEEWLIKEAAENRKIFFELFKLVHSEYERRKKEMDALTYNDIELLTHDLVSKNTKVAEYYREKYDHIFVDEFQDTNIMQKDVLFAISKQLFLVGDAKQSIYRFRNADVRVFIGAQNECSDQELEELKKNRRCLNKIIDTVNKAFPQIFSRTHSGKRRDFEADYLEFKSGREDKSAGCVEFIKAPSQSKHPNSFNHELEAEIALDIIKKGLASGKTYKDFAILFRISSHMSEFEKLFRQKGVPFIVYGGESRHDLLSGIRSLFSVILNPHDDHSMLEVLKQPYFYTSDEEIYKLKGKNGDIWNGLTTHPVKGFITEMRKIKDRGGFAEFVADVLRASKFIPSASLVFTGQDAGAEEAILRAAKHVESVGEGLEYFLDFIYGMKSDEIGTQIEAVKLMTVHASKGLEFNSVIIPSLDYAPKGAKDTIVISDDGEVAVKLGDYETNKKINTVFYHNIKDYEKEADTAESKRLFYVAMTRARNELYLLSDFEKGAGLEGTRWVDWISEIFKEDVKNYSGLEEQQQDIIRRKVIRTVSGAEDLIPLREYSVLKRYTVSAIKEKVSGVRPKGRLNDDQERPDPKTRLGNIIHSVLENWNDKDAVKSIYERIGDNEERTSYIINNFV
ncbi:MAG: UvrD-helicase domain-containing protein, partial [Pseudomonadota bacterium]